MLAIALACCIALAGSYTRGVANRQIAAFAMVVLTLIGLAIPLFDDSSGPERWISIGSLRLYVAPFLLPSFIAACSAFVGKESTHQMIYFAAVLGAAVLLAMQPDASQVLGLLVALVVVVARYRLDAFLSGVVISLLVLITLWAFFLPDPLEPVPYVEEVFALALGHSLFAGVAIIACATVLTVGLWIKSVREPFWLSAVAAYYTVLFVCSTAGITPAPLVGYGAGQLWVLV